MACKGLSTTAARTLVDRLCGEHNLPLCVLHDFDKSGFSILGTLKRSNRRYTFMNDVNVIDLGLRLDDVREYELELNRSHTANPIRRVTYARSATEEEIKFLC